MEPQVQASPDASQLAIIQKKLYADHRIRSGANWFYAIAGFSLLNTVIYLFGGHITFVIGLGATQIVDGVMADVAKGIGESGIVARVFGFVIDAAIAGVFVVFGILSRKRDRTSTIIGMVLYALDAVVLLLFQDILGTGFHVLGLFGIGGGLRAMSDLANLEKVGGRESIESLRQQMPSLQPRLKPVQWGIRLLALGVILLVIIAAVAIVSLQH